MYKIKQFFRRIYNLYRWFPIIWKDQDWDHSYIFEIFKFKLKCITSMTMLEIEAIIVGV